MLPSVVMTSIPSSLESRVARSTAVEWCSFISVRFSAVTSFPMARNSTARIMPVQNGAHRPGDPRLLAASEHRERVAVPELHASEEPAEVLGHVILGVVLGPDQRADDRPADGIFPYLKELHPELVQEDRVAVRVDLEDDAVRALHQVRYFRSPCATRASRLALRELEYGVLELAELDLGVASLLQVEIGPAVQGLDGHLLPPRPVNSMNGVLFPPIRMALRSSMPSISGIW